MSLFILNSKKYTKFLFIQLLFSGLLIIIFTYSFYDGINFNEKTPVKFLKTIDKLLHNKNIDKSNQIYNNPLIFKICLERYQKELNAMISSIQDQSNSEILIIYLPLGWNTDMNEKGLDIISSHINAKKIDYLNVYKNIFTTYSDYKIKPDDAHLSKRAHKLTYKFLSENYFDKINMKLTKYNTDYFKNISCFFPKNTTIKTTGWLHKTNSQGCRMNKNVTIDNLKNNYRVLLIGDSIVVPWSVDIEDGFPYMLQQKYKNMFIVNNGKNGKPYREHNKFINKYIKSIQPNLTIIQVQIASVASYYYSTPWNKHKATEEELLFEKEIKNNLYAYFYSFIFINILFILSFIFMKELNYIFHKFTKFFIKQ